ncbi:hypothetical protein SOVF_124110 [Spinacia oleracea]|nr:hypothetical protein SOVF_124110 [Spinacia oleracea]
MPHTSSGANKNELSCQPQVIKFQKQVLPVPAVSTSPPKKTTTYI